MKGYSFQELVNLAEAAVKRAGDTMTGNLTASKVLVSGAQGTEANALVRYDYLGGQLPTRAGTIPSGRDLNDFGAPGFYSQPISANAASGSNYPTNQAGTLLVFQHAGVCQIYITYQPDGGRRIYHRNKYTTTWSAWATLYDTNNKPTAAEVGAVSKAGDIMTGALYMKPSTVPGLALSGNTSGYSELVPVRLSGESVWSSGLRWYESDSTWRVASNKIYHEGFKPTAADVGALPVNANAVSATKLATAQTINGTNFDGTANITTANWGTTRTLTIGNSGKSVNGAGNVSWSLFEIGAARARGEIASGAPGNITTAEFVQWLKDSGAFNERVWIARGSWSYSHNKTITDTGCGNIHLAGCTIEVISSSESAFTIRIITPTTTSGDGTTGAEFVYVNNGPYYEPGWRRIYTTAWKPTAADVGAVSKAGDTMTGNLTAPKVLVSDAQGTEVNALTRKDYVDTAISDRLSALAITADSSLPANGKYPSHLRFMKPAVVTLDETWPDGSRLCVIVDHGVDMAAGDCIVQLTSGTISTSIGADRQIRLRQASREFIFEKIAGQWRAA